ncbi:MAG: type II toxin-antitoxin system mRNA interferase toxin, RelE/StbE family [Arcobacter sp.]|nr:type II toxin-antitoxin system mRNA interferase toxin, RelE/StbE family [Arcobacter sp.]|tara:strand:+ start:454 stop:723 length:270 start_codon:yes stop_codon:yes gene_type:complete
MALYKIKWKLSAKKEFKKIDKSEIKKIFTSIEKLSNDPFPSSYKKILGTESIYRIKIGNYRVIYSIEKDALIIEIIRVRHRKEAYRKFP